MRIITRYTLREILAPFFMALLAFTSLLIVNKLFNLTKFFVEKGVNPWYMVEMLVYFSPAVFVLTVPMAFLVAIVTAFGRMAADNEITAMKTAGISTHKLIIPVVIVSLALSVFMVFFMDFTIPRGNKAYFKIDMEIRRKHPALVLEQDAIMEEMSDTGRKWYFKSMDPETGRMKDIRIWERVIGGSGTPKLITAEEGELRSFDEWTSLKLYNGTIHQADRKDPVKSYVVGTFAEDEVVLNISSSLDKEQKVYSRARNMSIKEVKESVREFRGDLESPDVGAARKEYLRKYLIPRYLVEFYKKLSIPFACLAFGLIGVPVGLIVRRGGRMVGLGVGVGIITLYYVLLTAGERAATAGLDVLIMLSKLIGILPDSRVVLLLKASVLALRASIFGIVPGLNPFLGAWLPNILTCVVGIILIMRTVREAPIHSSRLVGKLFPSKNTDETDPEAHR
ncbi:LptF/LptG family permease [Candidatus Poribacteria bacterium]